MTGETVEDLFRRYGPAYRWLVTISGMIGSFTMVLTGTVVNVAVPNVMGAFGVGQIEAQFLSTAFIATMTASQLLNAWVVGTFGQRRAFVAVLSLFLVGSVICLTSPTLDFIIVGRVMQGFASGIVQPLVMVTIFQVFPSNRRGTAMGIYGMGLVLALGLGPVVGGLTIDTFDWRFVFAVPIPLVCLALMMGLVFMPQVRSESPPPFDWIGYGLLVGAIYCLMSATSHGQRDGWTSDGVVMLLTLGIGSGVAFVFSQLRAKSSLLDVTLFANPQFVAAVVIAFVFGAGNFATTYIIPIVGQLVQNFTPTLAGFLLLPASLFSLVLFPFMGRLSDMMPPSYPIMGGLLMFAAGAVFLAGVDANTPFWTFAAFAALGRVGMGFISPALLSCALKAVPTHKLNAGSGTINFFRQFGGATGISALVVLLEQRTQYHSDVLTTTQTPGNSTTRELLDQLGHLLHSGGVSPAVQPGLALHHLSAILEAQANTLGIQDGFLMTAAVFVAALVPAWILSRTGPGRRGAAS